MQESNLTFVTQLLKKRSGLVLTPDKLYLLESRLLPIAREQGLSTLDDLALKLKNNPPEKLLSDITEAMTTNESSFFRDGKPFELLRKQVLPLVRAGAESRNVLRIWSAAASTGQEPYTIAISLLEEGLGSATLPFEIHASDLAEKVLEKARAGIYSQFEVQRGMPIQMLVKYFTSLPDTTWQVNESLRKMVAFRAQNLLEDFSRHGKFDIIFCRNVLIYFDEPTKLAIIDRLANCLYPGGVLFLGSTESIIGHSTKLEELPGMRGIYRLG